MTAIEEFLYQTQKSDLIHLITEFALKENQLRIRIAPQSNATGEVSVENTVQADFFDVEVKSIQVLEDDEDLNVPWGVIGFDSTPHSEERYTFVVTTNEIEIRFLASWPKLITQN